MKKLLFVIFGMLICSISRASDPVIVELTGDISPTLKSKMEGKLSLILTAINEAHESSGTIDFEKAKVGGDVAVSLGALFDNTPFGVCDNELVLRCLELKTGTYQVREIPLVVDGDGEGDAPYSQEAVISFDKNGEIRTFYFAAVDQMLFSKWFESQGEIADLRRRQLILDYVEQFRTSYNQKDLIFLNKVFSEDALIVTGTVITPKKTDGILKPATVKYKKQTKVEYLSNLKNLFANKKIIRVDFDSISIVQHPNSKDFYGVTLRQKWFSGNSTIRGAAGSYEDDGYVFLVWDFRNEDEPLIHVRTWQPYMLDKKRNKTLPEDEIFTLGDFKLGID